MQVLINALSVKCNELYYKISIYSYQKKLCTNSTTQFQIEGGGLVQGVTKLFTTFSAFIT